MWKSWKFSWWELFLKHFRKRKSYALLVKILYQFIHHLTFERCCLTNSEYQCLLRYHCCLIAQSCPTLCNPMNYIYSLQSSSVHGISQARILEWVAISFCKGSSQSRYQTRVSKVHSLPLCHFWLISMTYLPYFPCQWPFQSYGRSTWTYLIQDGLSVNSIFYMLWSPCNIFTLILFKLH